jgi:HAE1 family hydrophobic/amphiphilic exporter-1
MKHIYTALFVLLAACPALSGANPQTPRVGVGIIQVKLGLQDTIEIALRNNLEIEIERQNRAGVYMGVKAAQGAYDPNFRYAPLIATNTTPTGSALQAADGRLIDRSFGNNFYLRQQLPWWGTQVQLSFENSRLSTSNTFVSLNPWQTSRLVLGVTQPLLRDRVTDQFRSQIKISRKQADISDVDYKLKVIDIVTRVQTAYWDLVAIRQDTLVKRDAVDWAREQVSRDQRMIDNGTLAPVELSGAEAELQRRLDTYISAVGTVTEAENSLKMLLAPGRDAEIWGDEIVPTEEKSFEPPQVDDLKVAIGMALEHRGELQSVMLRQQVAGIQKEQAANQIKPQLSLSAAYIGNGLGGSISTAPNPFSSSFGPVFDRLNALSAAAGLPPVATGSFGSLPPSLIGGYGTALSSLFGGSYPSVQAGLTFDFNIRNRTAQANLAEAAITEKRVRLEQDRTEQAIAAQVRNAMQAIETAKQRIVAAESSARAAQEKMDSETRLFQTGESTNFLVLTRQNELSDSRTRVVVAHLDFNRAIARLEQALGNSLEAHQIRLN